MKGSTNIRSAGAILAGACALALAMVPAAAAATDPGDSEDEARRHQEDGRTHFRVGEFEEAAAEFKAAYRLTREPSYLIDIAECYMELGDYDKALFFYQGYLKDHPDAPERAKVEEAIAHIERLMIEAPPDPATAAVEPGDAAATGSTSGAGEAAAVSAAASVRRLDTAKTLRLVGLVATIAGASGIVVGTVLLAVGAGLPGAVILTTGALTFLPGLPLWIVFGVRVKSLRAETKVALFPSLSPLEGGGIVGLTLRF